MLSFGKIEKFDHSYPEIIAHKAIDDWIEKRIGHCEPVAKEVKAIVKIKFAVIYRIEKWYIEPIENIKYLKRKPTYGE